MDVRHSAENLPFIIPHPILYRGNCVTLELKYLGHYRVLMDFLWQIPKLGSEEDSYREILKKYPVVFKIFYI